MQLTNRVALLTGGTRLGAAVADALAYRGIDLALTCHRSRAEAEATAARVRTIGRGALVVPADLTRGADCESAVERTVREFGRLDILIAMASVYESKPIDELTEQDWDRSLAVDLKAAFLCARAALPHLRAARGRIINITDWTAASGRPRYPGYLLYYVAKSGVMALTEALALELAPDGVLVNAIAPGPILAPPGTTDAEHRAVERATPLGAWGGAAEVVKAVLALLDSDFITGETIRVDGGRHLR